MRAYVSIATTVLLAGCVPPSAQPIPAPVVEIGSACVGSANSPCLYHYEYTEVDCKLFPIKGVVFQNCLASKIYSWSAVRGSGRAQIYMAGLSDDRYISRLYYFRELTGNGGGHFVETADHAREEWPKSNLFDDGTDVHDVRIAWEKGNTFAVDFKSKDHPCKGFRVSGPFSAGHDRALWTAKAFYCSRNADPVSEDDFEVFRTALKYE